MEKACWFPWQPGSLSSQGIQHVYDRAEGVTATQIKQAADYLDSRVQWVPAGRRGGKTQLTQELIEHYRARKGEPELIMPFPKSQKQQAADRTQRKTGLVG